MNDEIVQFARQWWRRREQTLVPNTWLGIPCWQNPLDVWIIQEIIAETRPEVIVETGTFAGGGATLWASLLSMFGEGRVITVDIREELHAGAVDHPLARDRVTFVTGSSTDRETFTKVALRCMGARTMVILDSDHRADHVFAELDLWSPLVTRDNYTVVQDGIVTYLDDDMGPGPLEALGRWLPDHPVFEVDETREPMMFTLCPSGFLRRRSS
jgi:cephalosporin hydroxylase